MDDVLDREPLEAAVDDPVVRGVALALERVGLDAEALDEQMRTVSERPETQTRILRARAEVIDATGATTAAFDRAVLLLTAARSLERLYSMPVSGEVQSRTRTVFERLASGSMSIDGPANRFVQFAKIVSLRRWPAGLFDWEVSGLPRSWLPKIRPAPALARTAAIVARRGFGPLFFAHLTICRRVHALMPKDALQSYALMAGAMALQPEIKGLITASWFHSPDTFRVSPHLSWLNDVFLQNGGIVATIGDAELDCGVFARSPERRRAYQEGRFKPTIGLIVWPREEMIRWADRRRSA